MLARIFGWVMLAALAVYVLNNYLMYWRGLPGAGAALSGDGSALSWLQLAFYPIAIAAAVAYVAIRRDVGLREDADRICNINTFFIRAAFWAVVLIGVADLVISFLRVEELLPGLFGDQMALDLGRSTYRGTYVHFPLAVVGLGIAAFTRTLGFTWLALLVVVAELLIVIGRFVFSYEQAFMADLVRFWYAALFLFASAYTLLEDGHVRVDIYYANQTRKRKGLIDALGAVFLGMTLCWTILIIGMASKSAIINSPLLVFEITQAGFGLYVKYLMAGFLGVFAISMMIQFVSAFLSGIADYCDEPGGVKHEAHPMPS